MSALLIYKGVPDQIEVGDSNNTGEFRVGDIVMVVENIRCFEQILVPAGYICRVKHVNESLCLVDDGGGARAWTYPRRLRLMYREEK